MQHEHVQLMRPTTRLRNQAGLTLMEVLVASVLGMLAVGAMNSFTRYQLFTLRNQAVQSDTQMVARSVSDIFARDVRRSGLNPMCTAGVDAIDYAKPDEVRLEADLDRDGAIDGPGEVLTYQLVSTTAGDRLERVSNGITDILLDNIDLAATRFRYFDDDGAEVSNGLMGLTTADRATIRRVRLELEVDAKPVDPTRSIPMRVRLANDVDIRNRHFVNSVSCP